MVVEISEFRLKTIREFEINQVANQFPKKGRSLEIGAGIGWQSHFIKNLGLDHYAIDLCKSIYYKDAIFPIILYDGETLPFANNTFEMIFSSNVLEHIAHVVDFQNEIYRVCKPNGIIIHVLPSPTWRLWTSATHYWRQVQLAWIYHSSIPQNSLGERIKRVFLSIKTSGGNIIRNPFPQRHGEFGNFITEMYYYSSFRWWKLFNEAGFEIVNCYPNRLFYTGSHVLNEHLSINNRAVLSKLLGSSCNFFILRNSGK